MEKEIRLLALKDNLILVSQIEEVSTDFGEPDCKLIKPFVVEYNQITNTTVLTPWLSDYSFDEYFMIHSDKILTIATPKPTIVEKYQNLIK